MPVLGLCELACALTQAILEITSAPLVAFQKPREAGTVPVQGAARRRPPGAPGSWQPGLPGWTGNLSRGSRSHGSNTMSLSDWPCHLNRLQTCGRGGVSTPHPHPVSWSHVCMPVSPRATEGAPQQLPGARQ
ncbi:hypothetical protein MC885_012190, partial [Smutsia gigantea]